MPNCGNRKSVHLQFFQVFILAYSIDQNSDLIPSKVHLSLFVEGSGWQGSAIGCGASAVRLRSLCYPVAEALLFFAKTKSLLGLGLEFDKSSIKV